MPNVRANAKLNWRLGALILFVFLLALLPRVSALDVFLAPDERAQWERSNTFFLALAQGDFGGTLLPDGHPAITLMWFEALAVWIKYGVLTLLGQHPSIESLLGLERSFELLPEKRFVIGLVNALIVLGIYLLTRRVFNGKVALLGAILLAFDPFLLTESRIARSEALMGGFMTLSVLFLILYLQEGRWRTLALSGAMAGLATLSKLPGVFLGPFTALVLLAYPLARRDAGWRAKLQPAVKGLAVWGVAAAFVFWAAWPAMWVRPLDVIRLLYDVTFSYGVAGLERRSFFMGQATIGDPGFFFYALVLLFRSTPAQWLGATGLLLALAARLRGERLPSPWALGTLVLLGQCLLFGLLMSVGNQKYDRYIIPIFPSLNLLAAVGLMYLGGLGQRLLREREAIGGLLSSLALPGLLVLQVATALPHHPYYYTYYNPLLGGGKQAVKYIPVGTGEGIDQAVECFNKRPDAQSLTLACANTQKCEALFPGKTVPIEDDLSRWVQADYVLLYISQVQRNKHPPGLEEYLQRHSPECVVALHGLEYAWIYKGPAAQHLGGSGLLEGRGTLLGYDLGGEARAGGALPVKLYWRNEGRRPDDELYVRLVDAGGYEWTRGVAEPLADFVQAAQKEDAIVESLAEVAIPPGTPPGTYYLKVGFYSLGQQEVVGEFALPAGEDKVEIERGDRHIQDDQVAMDYRLGVELNEDLRLLGYDLGEEKDGAVQLALYWRALRDVKADYVLAVRLLDRQGVERAYWLGRPVWSGYPTDGWSAGEVVKDPWELTLENVTEGEYTLEVEAYNAETESSAGKARLGTLRVGIRR
jgi:4-amino-4-deoxy-L-arabinose transferase-like glycosyltransferase